MRRAVRRALAAPAIWSALVGLLIAAIVIHISGYSALDAFTSLGTGATGIAPGIGASHAQATIRVGPWVWNWNGFLAAQSLAKATPLLLCGLAVAIGLKGGLFNIGAQGQMTCGALAAAMLGSAAPSSSQMAGFWIPVALATGAMGGALWGAVAGLLKSWRGVHEVISTIMLNYVAINAAEYLITHNLRTPHSLTAATRPMQASTWLPPLVHGSNLTIGFPLALAAAFGSWFLLYRTSIGFRLRMVGSSAGASRAAGIHLGASYALTMALSGALAGLAGAVAVMGVHHQYMDGVAGTYGFDAIAVALLGGLSPGPVAVSALFFGGLVSGSAYMEIQTGVPATIAVIVQAIVILCAGARILRPKLPPSEREFVPQPDRGEGSSFV